KRNNTAVRIGSNHGSLSERIVDRFGDTPMGMVESAMEFVRICREMDFHNIVLSMKASNVRIMVYATRLLVKKMIDEGMDYPIHLGVTEAGDGMQGRIKSAVGIGTLLADGIGDTIRVSLTEDPVNEIPVAQKIASYFKASDEEKTSNIFQDFFYSPFEYNPRESSPNSFLSEYPSPIVIGWDGKNQALNPDIPASFIKSNEGSDLFSNLNPSDLTGRIPDIEENKVICYQPDGSYSVKDFRHLFRALNSCKINNPVILHKKYATTKLPDLVIESAIDFGPLFLDGFGEGIFIECDNLLNKGQLSEIAFQVLQASGARISQTEYIACPSCGRTLYDIQSALKSIKNETSHLTGLKIAVMGCIVNGPGEMADADYGYVGMGRGKVALYKGKKQVKSGVDENMAVQQLIELIKTGGDWHEPQ
nr:(E)-4-hydroxy-3-methylbut-2-enyl-diphosphate synthase [Bacteroidota bacterium]